MVVAPGAASARRLLMRSCRSAIQAPTRRGAWLIIAPHPDDESLGVGGLLAARAAVGETSFVAFLTDGCGSHVGVPGWSPARVGQARRAEGRHALAALGLATAPLFLGWQDAAPPSQADVLLDRSTAYLVAFCHRHGIGTVLTTWDGEPHCDHEAAAALGRAVAARSAVVHLEYMVWGWTIADLEDRVASRRVLSFDVSRGRGRQRRAIACHRSQFGGRITGGGKRFRLSREMARLAGRSHLILLSRRHRDAA